MKILHINDKLHNAGGVEVYIRQLIELAPQFDMDCNLMSIGFINSCLRIQFLNEDEKMIKKNWKNQLDSLIATFDILHVHSLSEPKILEFLLKQKPVVRSMHDPRMICPGKGKFWQKSEKICTIPFGLHCLFHTYTQRCSNRHPKRLTKAFTNTNFEIKKASSQYSNIIAMSNYIKKEAISAGIKSENLTVNPLFTKFIPEDQLNTLNSNKKRKTILFIGRLSKTKGVHYLIKSGLILLEKNYNIVIDIVGDGHDREYFEKMVPKHYSDKIIFHGWRSRDEINEFLKNCYLLAFPSIYPEAFGISGIEAMMHGKPVVAFDVGGVSTWLTNKKTGFLIEAKDTSQFSNKIELLLNNHDVYRSLSENARKDALNRFTPEIHINKLLHIYKNVLVK